jgi:chorismate lyase/3-hydroxybenzoate synthase
LDFALMPTLDPPPVKSSETTGPTLLNSPGASCRVIFGQALAQLTVMDNRPVLKVDLPTLAGAGEESLLVGANEVGMADGFALFRAGGRLAGFAVAPVEADIEAAASDLYQSLFKVTRGLHLCRIWNYVPQINAVEQGLENYRRFCRGRSLAFEQHFGTGFKKLLPAGSAIGAGRGPLALGFVAATTEPHHFENPRQVPAFEYPQQYGPRPPSFARATALTEAAGRQVFISGTAAIRGHATVAVGDLDGQIACTLENLRLIAATAGAGDQLGAGWQRTFKVYLRHAADLPRVTARFSHELLRAGDDVQYLLADLCRADLLVEIESILRTVA